MLELISIQEILKMNKQISTAVLAIIVSLFPISNSISPPVALAQTPPQVECLDTSGIRGSEPVPRAKNITPNPISGAVGFITDEMLRNEAEERGRYTQKFGKKLSEQFPDHNIVIAHKVGQVTGDNFSHTHCKLGVPFGRTIGYEIYLSPKGKPFTLEKNGDGGFQNWYHIGDFEVNGNTLKAK